MFAADRPAFDPMMVDRFLVLVAQSGISPVLAVNKADLVDPEGLAEQVGPYQAIGFPVVTTSARDGDVADLVGLLEQRVTVFAGPSGVGKSSLLNAVHPGLELKALDVSEKIQRGRHTTTFASLYPLELSSGLALVADTPGYSHLDFGPLAPDQLGWLFPEMAPHIPDCRFQDCLHRSEPGCAVKERAELSESRYASYLRFLDELEAKAARLSSTSLKDEGTVKSKAIAGGGETKLIKLGVAARSASRRLVRQQLATDLHEDEGEIEDDLDETEE